MENPNNIDNFFKKEFSEFSPEPPAHLWQNIEHKLASKKTPWYKRKRLLYISGSIILLSLLLLYFLENQEIEKATNDRPSPKSESTPIDTIGQAEQNSIPFKKSFPGNRDSIRNLLKTNGSGKEINKEEKTAVTTKENFEAIQEKEIPIKIKEPEPEIQPKDSIRIETVQEEPKSFYDKYSPKKKDSSRTKPIFIPDK